MPSINFGYSGLGPRHQIELAMSVLLILVYRDQFERFAKAHGQVPFVYNVFEQQQDATGGGNAFQSDSHGMINGGLGTPATIEGADTLPQCYREFVDDVCNLPKRVAEKAKADRANIALEYNRISAVAAVMFNNAFDGNGNLKTDVECGTRGFVGRVAQECFDRVLDFAKTELSDLVKIIIHPGATVLDVNLLSPQRPSLKVQMQDGTTKDWTFDFVSLAHGTAQRVPVSGEVAARSYTETPNFDAIKSFLQSFDLLDTDALLKPGTSIAIGGLSLAMIDMLMILLNFTGIIVQDTTTTRGYRINEEAAQQYLGAFTLFNREPGVLSGLRTQYDQDWKGVSPLLTPEEVHAGWMHNRDMLAEFLALAKADVAASLGKKPADINRPMSTEERLSDYGRQIDAMHAAAGKPNLTESGLFRAACQSILNGQGLAGNPAAAEAALSSKYPVSRAATAGWPIQRALPNLPTDFEEAVLRGNSHFYEAWRKIQNSVASAPSVCLGIIAALFKLGVICYHQASYKDVMLELTGLVLNGHRFDVLFAPRIIDGGADPLLTKLRWNVLTNAGQPVFAKGRYYKMKDGTVTHVCDAGLVGHGSPVETIDGKLAMAGVSWADTNARLSALQRAPAAAMIELAAALRLLSGDATPLAKMGKSSIDPDAYAAEMKSLGPLFDTLQEKLRLLRAIEQAGNAYPGQFKDCHALLATSTGRQELEEQLRDIIRIRSDRASQITAALDAEKVCFSPLTPEMHYRRFIDFTDEEAATILAGSWPKAPVGS